MANGFATDIKIGYPTKEIVILGTDTMDRITAYSEVHGNAQGEVQNTVAERFTSVQRLHQVEWNIEAQGATEEFVNAFRSLNALRDQHVAFVYAGPWAIYSEEYTLESLTTFTMKTSPYLLLDKAYNTQGSATRTLQLSRVSTTYDAKGAQSGTNFIATAGVGALNRSTWVVTLDSSPGAIGTKVYVNYTYSGALAKIMPPGFNIEWGGKFDAVTGKPVFNVTGMLAGV